MEREASSGSCLMSDDDIIKNPEIWRNGPASFIYDQLGIPEDCTHLDYSVVLQPVTQWDPPHVEADKQRLLELAVQSIMPEDEKDVSMQGTWNISPETNHAQYVCPPDHYQCDSIDGVFSNSSSKATLCSQSAELSSQKISYGNVIQAHPETGLGERQGLRMLVCQLEESKATSTLEQEMNVDDGDEVNIMDTRKVVSFFHENERSTDDSYALVSQIQWEKDIIWDATNVNCISISRNKQLRAGWIPSQDKRTATIATEDKQDGFKSLFSYESEELIDGAWENEIIWDANDFRSKLLQPKLPVFDVADDDIIFKMPKEFPNAEISEDSQQHRAILKKPLLQPHTMKSKLLLGKTGFIQWKWKQEQLEEQLRQDEKNRSVARAGVDKRKNQKLKFSGASLNISNDEFYRFKTKETVDANTYNCRHSRLVKNFVAPFIQTHLNADELRNFHRPKLSSIVIARKAPETNPNLYNIKSLANRIKNKFDERKKMSAQGQPILFDKGIDISARDGTIILMENSEEYPPLLSQVGMCSQIINYYKRKSLREVEYAPLVGHEFGEISYVSSSSSSFPFLGTIQSGQVLSGIRNNMYHSPIYWQGTSETDFLVIRTRLSGYMIREMDGMFTVGQQCPVIEVPEPNSTKLKNFLKEFVETFVYRKYLACTMPAARTNEYALQSTKIVPKVRMDVIAQHFPTIQESTIKAILKNSSELKRVGNVAWMVKKPEFILPSEEALTEKVSPEDVCAYYSLLAAEQRLRDTGLDSMLALHEHGADNLDGKKGRKSLNPQSAKAQQQHQQHSPAFEEELLSAPWNTTSAYLAAVKGKCLLQVTGPADPTGCGEGYSYVRVTKRGGSGLVPGSSSTAGEEPVPHGSGRGRPKKCPPRTGGTDADLRKLSTKTAKDLLKKIGVPEKEIEKLSRWEVIDLVRTLSTEKVMQGESIDKTISKFCRWKNIHSTVMNQERYKEACQNVFELQNKVLSSREDLSTDDDDSEDDEFENGTHLSGASKKDIEQMGKKVEKILCGDVDIIRMSHEEEELERLELQKMMLGGIMAKDADIAKRKASPEHEKELAQKSKASSEDILADLMKNPKKALKITRTFKVNGESFPRTEIVRDPLVIAAYLRIRNSKSEEFIKQFLHKADRREKKEKKQKERMFLGQLQDIAKVEVKKVVKLQVKRKREMEDEYFPNKEAKKEAEKTLRRQGRKCGACGMPGHMRTSKDCPMYNQDKIEKMIKKREGKKQKDLVIKSKIQPPTLQSKLQIGQADLNSSTDETDDSDSGATSSSDDDSDESYPSSILNDSREENNLEPLRSTVFSSQEDPIVKTDGLKMFVRKSMIQGMIVQAKEQEAKKHEVARILATMALAEGDISSVGTPSGPVTRRRISQTEREHADYLNNRKYKTTAADRRSSRAQND